MKLSRKLKELRIANGLTQENIAKELSVSRTLITKIESGNARPTDENLRKYSSLFNVSYEELKTYDDNYSLTSLDKKKISFLLISTIVLFLYCLFTLLPIFKYGYWDNELINNEGQKVFIHGVVSISSAFNVEKNPLCFITIAISIVSAVLNTVTLIFLRNKKESNVLFIISICVIIVLIILAIIKTIVGLSIIYSGHFHQNSYSIT